VNERVAYVVLVALDSLPILLVAIGWVLAIRSADIGRWSHLWPLIVVTVSVFWLDGGLTWPSLWGASYSHVRFAILDGNFLAMLGAVLGSFRGKSRSLISTRIAASVLALAWAFLSAINAAV
jgi:hypothetical protein